MGRDARRRQDRAVNSGDPFSLAAALGIVEAAALIFCRAELGEQGPRAAYLPPPCCGDLEEALSNLRMKEGPAQALRSN